MSGKLIRRSLTMSVAVALAAAIGAVSASSAEAYVPSTTVRSCWYGPTYDPWSQHATGVMVSWYATYDYSKGVYNVYAKGSLYRPDSRNRYVAKTMPALKIGSAYQAVPLMNQYYKVATINRGISVGDSVHGYMHDTALGKQVLFSKTC